MTKRKSSENEHETIKRNLKCEKENQRIKRVKLPFSVIVAIRFDETGQGLMFPSIETAANSELDSSSHSVKEDSCHQLANDS